jgi:tetraacyldisaccharide 4'-kinase
MIVFNRRFPDHYLFSEEEISRIYRHGAARQAEMVITTEKDAVRIPAQWLYPLPSFYLRIEIRILEGQESFHELMDKICHLAAQKYGP